VKNRKTPQEKKELDYDRQRRTHWDSQKAARKAIPASKRAARQIIRKRSSELLNEAVVNGENVPTAAEMAELERRERYRKYGRGETLREHVQHIQREKKKQDIKSPEFHAVSNFNFYDERAFDLPYATDVHKRELISHFHILMNVKNRRGIGNFEREQAAMIHRCIEEDRPLVRGFFADGPGWKPKLLAWTQRILGRKPRVSRTR